MRGLKGERLRRRGAFGVLLALLLLALWRGRSGRPDPEALPRQAQGPASRTESTSSFIDADGRDPGTRTGLPVKPPEEGTESMDGEVRLRLEDPEGRPAPGVKVGFSLGKLTERDDGWSFEGVERAEGTTGLDGEAVFRVAGRHAGLWMHAGLHKEEPWALDPKQQREGFPFPNPLQEGECRTVVLGVYPCISLLVEIASTDGRPVDARLYVQGASSVGFRNGRALCTRIDPRQEVLWSVRATSHRSSGPHGLAGLPQLGNRYEARLVLEPGAALEGLVVDPDGSPSGYARILYCLEGEDVERAVYKDQHLLADKEGSFRIGGLEEGRRYSLQFQAGDNRSLPKNLVAVPGTRLLVALEEGGVLVGQVVDEEGAPIPGANVNVSEPPPPSGRPQLCLAITADEEGRFRFASLPDGPFNVRALPPGMRSILDFGLVGKDEGERTVHASGYEGVPAGALDLRIVLKPEGGIQAWP